MIAFVPETSHREPGENFFNVRAACAFFSCGRTTLYKYLALGLPSHRIGGHRLFSPADCKEFARRFKQVRTPNG